MSKKPRIITKWIHRLGRIVIDQGIGDGDYGAYILKENGCLSRFMNIKTNANPEAVRMQLENYKGKALKVDPKPFEQMAVDKLVHLDGGSQAACGSKGPLVATVFLSSVTCPKCKQSELYEKKLKKHKAAYAAL
jgi:hypothetical protein